MSTINAARFTGFADVYDAARPSMPIYAAEAVELYLGRRPGLVVDLGCGTGLSTLAWAGRADRVVGVEPSGDMLAEACKKQQDGIEFVRGFSHEVPLGAACADAVVCSQSFHWMEPAATLREANRLLKRGGVFATVDCDWPPVFNWQAEKAYMELMARVDAITAEEKELQSTFVRYPKAEHLRNIEQSGHFRYSREIVFANRELSSKRRILALAMSQGGLQNVLRLRPEKLAGAVEALEAALDSAGLAEQFQMDFCYRMRIAVK